jgi:hypothetical protein
MWHFQTCLALEWKQKLCVHSTICMVMSSWTRYQPIINLQWLRIYTKIRRHDNSYLGQILNPGSSGVNKLYCERNPKIFSNISLSKGIKGHYTFFIAKVIITSVFFFITASSNMHCADNILSLTKYQLRNHIYIAGKQVRHCKRHWN